MTCGEPIGEWDLAPDVGTVPGWARVQGSLMHCVGEDGPVRMDLQGSFLGASEGSPREASTTAPPGTLGWPLDHGQAASLLVRQPASRSATLATTALRAQVADDSLRTAVACDELLRAAKASTAAGLRDQALFQQCSALALAAARGDRRALTTLDRGLSREQDPFAHETLERCLHEAACAYLSTRIAGVPDSLDGDPQQVGRWLDALNALFAVKREPWRKKRTDHQAQGGNPAAGDPTGITPAPAKEPEETP